jgi:hypothetical protein
MRPLTFAVLLLALLLAVAAVALAATRATPPHIVRIYGEPAFVRLPNGALFELPIGSEFPAQQLRYLVEARVVEIHGTAEIFRDGFED